MDYDHSGNVSLEEIDGEAYEAMERGDDLLGPALGCRYDIEFMARDRPPIPLSL